MLYFEKQFNILKMVMIKTKLKDKYMDINYHSIRWSHDSRRNNNNLFLQLLILYIASIGAFLTNIQIYLNFLFSLKSKRQMVHFFIVTVSILKGAQGQLGIVR